ncbi:MAG: hypothetical protein KDB18_14275, partial [Salinibacterium sp.]|nr:hypothetical protein [Salinibacterium sp.]
VPALNLGEIDENPGATHPLRLLVRPGHTLAITGLRGTSPLLTAEARPFGDPDGEHGFEISLRFSAKAPVGRFVGSLLVETDSPIRPRDHLNVLAEVLGPVGIQPTSLGFGEIPRRESKTLTLQVDARDDTSVAIEKVVCKDERIKTQIVELEPGRSYRVEVTLTASGSDALISSFLYVVTNQARQKYIRVPFRATVKAPSSGR